MKQDLIDQLKRLGMGRLDAAEAIAELLMPEAKTVDVNVPLAELQAALDAGAVVEKAE